MKVRLLLSVGLVLGVLLIGTTWQAIRTEAQTPGQPIGNLSIDTQTAGNTASAVGTINATRNVTDNPGGASFTVDLVLGNDSSSDGGGAAGGITVGAPESGGNCANNTDDDADTAINDGCPVGSDAFPEFGATCTNNTDDDSDGLVNDGCPVSSGLDVAGWNARIIFDPAVLTFKGFQFVNCSDDEQFGAVPPTAQFVMEKASPCGNVSGGGHSQVINPPAAPGIGTFDIGSFINGTPPGAVGVGKVATLIFDAATSGAAGTCIEIGNVDPQGSPTVHFSFYADIKNISHQFLSGAPATIALNDGTAPSNCQNFLAQEPTPSPTPSPTPTPGPGTPTPTPTPSPTPTQAPGGATPTATPTATPAPGAATATPTPTRAPAGALPRTGGEGPAGGWFAPMMIVALGLVLLATGGAVWRYYEKRGRRPAAGA